MDSATTTCWVSPRPGLGWGGGLVLPKRSFLRKKAEAEKAHLSKDPNKSQASSNSPATLELEGGLAASRPPGGEEVASLTQQV